VRPGGWWCKKKGRKGRGVRKAVKKDGVLPDLHPEGVRGPAAKLMHWSALVMPVRHVRARLPQRPLSETPVGDPFPLRVTTE
jgi:hypothetical protein